MSFFDGATLEVGIAFGKGAGEGVVDGDYTDVTADVREVIRIDRGRGSEFDTFTTGTLQLVLDNRSLDYDPENTSGPHYGDLLPMRHIRVRVTYDAVTAYLFKGYIRSWNQGWEISDNDATAIIIADDGFKILAQTKLPESIFWTEITTDTPAMWYRFGESSGDDYCLDASGNGRYGTYSSVGAVSTASGLIAFSDDGARATQVLDAAIIGQSIATAAYYATGTTWTIEFWYKSNTGSFNGSMWTQSTSVPNAGSTLGAVATNYFELVVVGGVMTASWTDGTTAGSATYGSAVVNDGATHHIAFTRSGSTVKLYIDGAESTATASTGSMSVGGTDFGYIANVGIPTTTTAVQATFDEVCVYTSALSAARVLAHYQAGATAYAGDVIDDRIVRVLEAVNLFSVIDLFADASSITAMGCDFGNGSTTVLAYLQSLGDLEDGRVFMAADGTLTFHSRYHDTGQTVAYAFSDETTTDYPYRSLAPRYDDARIINDVSATRVSGVPQRTSDVTSKTTYGTRSVALSGLMGESDAEMFSLASGLVAKYKDPLLRFESITVRPMARPATLMPVVSDAEIGYRVSVRRDPLRAGAPYTKELSVEGISHRITVGGEWETEYLTAPADISDTWLVLDDAALGLLDTGRVGY